MGKVPSRRGGLACTTGVGLRKMRGARQHITVAKGVDCSQQRGWHRTGLQNFAPVVVHTSSSNHRSFSSQTAWSFVHSAERLQEGSFKMVLLVTSSMVSHLKPKGSKDLVLTLQPLESRDTQESVGKEPLKRAFTFESMQSGKEVQLCRTPKSVQQQKRFLVQERP